MKRVSVADGMVFRNPDNQIVKFRGKVSFATALQLFRLILLTNRRRD